MQAHTHTQIHTNTKTHKKDELRLMQTNTFTH